MFEYRVTYRIIALNEPDALEHIGTILSQHIAKGKICTSSKRQRREGHQGIHEERALQ